MSHAGRCSARRARETPVAVPPAPAGPPSLERDRELILAGLRDWTGPGRPIELEDLHRRLKARGLAGPPERLLRRLDRLAAEGAVERVGPGTFERRAEGTVP